MSHRKQFDEYGDWGNAPTADDIQPEQEVAKVSLEDFVIREKAMAFLTSYTPCPDGMEYTEGVETFNDAQLRQLFKAYVCGLGDPLSLYIDELKTAGFLMKIHAVTGKPTIFAIRR